MKQDILVRAGKTFVQAFLAALAVSSMGINDMATAKAAVLAGIAAGISATWNFIVATK